MRFEWNETGIEMIGEKKTVKILLTNLKNLH
jgi:hypothetical protein